MNTSTRPMGSRLAALGGRTRMHSIDPALVVTCIALLLFGLVMVYSASIALADGPRFSHQARTHYLSRHVMFMAVGLVGALIVFCITMERWQHLARPLFLLALVPLALVLVPGIGVERNGAMRWLPLPMGFNLQPSEIMKLAVLLYAADYAARRQDRIHLLAGFIPMALAVGFAGSLVLVAPDLGAFVVIVAIAMGILFVAGVSARLFAVLTGVMGTLFVMLIWLSPWRRQRLFAYLDPWNEDYVQGTGYQLSHSLIALGRGEWFGVGLGSSVEKLHYLPEAHTDFIVAVIGEELGFIGVFLLLLLFFFLVRRAFEIGRQAIAMDRTFSGLVAQGVGIWLGVQVFINVGVCLGVLPTKGLTLPLVSYGGSALVSNLAALALLLRVDFENRILMRGGRL